LLSLVQLVMVGVMFRKILNPTCVTDKLAHSKEQRHPDVGLPIGCQVWSRDTLEIISAVSLKFEHRRMVFDFAR